MGQWNRPTPLLLLMMMICALTPPLKKHPPPSAMCRLARHWSCEQLLGLPEGALGPPRPAAAAAAAAATAAGSDEAAAAAAAAADDSRPLLGQAIPRGCVLTAVGRGLDPSAR